MGRKYNKYTLKFCQDFVKDHGECLSIEYKNMTTKMQWKCNCGNKWGAVFDSIYNHKSWCPICAQEKKQEKIKVTNLKRYGVENVSQVPDKQEKRRITHLERYGVEYAQQNKEIQEKTRITYKEKTGYDYPQQNPEVREKGKVTNLNRYGTENPQQNREIALKTARSQAITQIKFHWLTNEELVCQGSWEAKVVDYLNANKINYKWQSETFKLIKCTYRPDLYLVDEDIWIEIKGRKREDAMLKWDEFKLYYPTAELWDEKKLKQMNIL